MEELEVVHQFPPNFDLIKAALPHASERFTYCYGNKIYSPDGHEVSPDVNYHESIHADQQQGEPDAWYAQYLTDREFRLSQELEAYGLQYAFARNHILDADEKARQEGKRLAVGSNKLIKWALESMARELSGDAYGGLIGYTEAEAKIRNYGKMEP